MDVIQGNFKLHKRQIDAFNLLRDKKTHTVVYGGGIGGGKSRLIAAFLIWSALTYAGTRYLLARARLTDLKDSTLISLFDTASEMGIRDALNYNQQSNTITFPNGSVIRLREVTLKPSDPTMNELGSTEYTAVCLDEIADGIDEKVWRVSLQRLRYKLSVNGIIGKVLMCSNPTKGWLFNKIYLPWEAGILPPGIAYIPALPHENPFLDPSSRALLTPDVLGEDEYRVKVLGDWHYAITDSDLFIETDLINACTWDTMGVNTKGKTLSIDVASKTGNDSTVAMLFDGHCLTRCWTWKGKDTIELHREISAIISQFQIPIRNVIVDAIGVGQGLADLLRGCYQFKANHTRLNDEGFASMRDQMVYKAAELITRGQLRIKVPEVQEQLIKELCAHKRHSSQGGSGLAKTTPKDQIARSLGGKSPDYADAFCMAMYAIAYRKRELKVDIVRF